MEFATHLLGWILLSAGGIILAVNGNYAGYEAGKNDYKYVSNEATYSTLIDGQKVEYSYGKINELIAKDRGYVRISGKPNKEKQQ